MAGIFSWPTKLVEEELRPGLDWSGALDAGETITSCVAEITSGAVTVDDPEVSFMDGLNQFVWLKAGTPGLVELRLSVNTDAGRTLTQRVMFRILA